MFIYIPNFLFSFFLILEVSLQDMQALLDENINSTEGSGSNKNEWFTEQTYSQYRPSGPRNLPELSQESYRTSIYTDTTQDHRSTCDHSSTYDGSLLIRSPSCSADFIRIKSQPVVPPTSNSPSSPYFTLSSVIEIIAAESAKYSF